MNQVYTKILSAAQTRQLDQQTIQREPIASIDLMERASQAFTDKFLQLAPPSVFNKVLVMAGTGNNGGDGLAVARLLAPKGYHVQVITPRTTKRSTDNQTNLDRLSQFNQVSITGHPITTPLPDLSEVDIIIDALFGSGLNRPLSGDWVEWVTQLNASDLPIISVDLPSGLIADAPSDGVIIHATHTISFQLPKLAFFAAENAPYLGHWQIVNIDLLPAAISTSEATNYYVQPQQVKTQLKSRGRFDHKGTFGHALIAAGSYGKVGAAILSAKAALRTGCGLVTTHLPRCGYEIMQVAFPEAMVQVDRHRLICTQIALKGKFASIAAGPGWGTNPPTQRALLELLQKVQQPLILDADALNILAQNPDWHPLIPQDSILTPHPKEFERLFGATDNSFDTWERLRERAQTLKIFILLKGGNTVIGTPSGDLLFTNVGNPGMSTAGAGDVLTGILAGLLAQGYSSQDTVLLGTILHGLAGDLAAQAEQMESLIAEDIIKYLGAAFKQLRQ